MRCDSIEFGWKQKAAQRRRTASAMDVAYGRASIGHDAMLDIMDEAFASFDGSIGDRTKPPIDGALVKTLAAQLETLDRQRAHLADLLRTIEVTPVTSPSAAL